MENAKRVVDDILARNKKDRLLAVLLYLVFFMGGSIVYLYHQNQILYAQKQLIIESEQQDKIDFLKTQNDYLLKLKNEVDSANTKLQLFNIQKQMR